MYTNTYVLPLLIYTIVYIPSPNKIYHQTESKKYFTRAIARALHSFRSDSDFHLARPPAQVGKEESRWRTASSASEKKNSTRCRRATLPPTLPVYGKPYASSRQVGKGFEPWSTSSFPRTLASCTKAAPPRPGELARACRRRSREVV